MIHIPFSNVQSTHDDLARHATDLHDALLGPLLQTANGSVAGWQRLEGVIEEAEAAWTRHLKAGGNPRVTETSWRIAVADLADAVLRECLAEAAALPAAQRKQRLEDLRGQVDAHFAEAPSYLGMKLRLRAALNAA